MGKPIVYPDSGGSYERKSDGKLDLVQATEPLPPVPESPVPEPAAPATPATRPAPLKSTQES